MTEDEVYTRAKTLLAELKGQGVIVPEHQEANVFQFVQSRMAGLARAARSRSDAEKRIDAAIRRYENPDEPHNKSGGWPRPQLAWAMYSDLKGSGQDAPYLACSVCGRKSWSASEGDDCAMQQPDGSKCEGAFTKAV